MLLNVTCDQRQDEICVRCDPASWRAVLVIRVRIDMEDVILSIGYVLVITRV